MKRTVLLAIVALAYATLTHAQTWYDVTEDFVTNPKFNGNIDGWEDNFWEASQNHGYQSANYRNQSIFISQFAEAWRPNNDWWTGGVLGDGSISQQLTGLPAGRFRLEVDAIATDQGYRNDPVSGVLLFINDGTTEAVTSMSTGNGAPEHFSVEMPTTQSELTIGVRTENTTANWLAFDNVKLSWSGNEVKATRLTIPAQATIGYGETIHLDYTLLPANTTFKRVAWESSDPSVARIDAEGNITGIGVGQVTITCYTVGGGNNLRATCTLTVERNFATAEQIIINEVQQANVDMFIDPSFNYGGWIEIFNPTNRSASLGGYYLSDDPANLKKARINVLAGALPANGYLTLWLDHYSRWAPTMVNMKLDCDGGAVYLSDPEGQLITSFTYPPAITRTSYARTTDGGSTWQYTDQPTPGASNSTAAYAATRLPAPSPDVDGCLFSYPFVVNVNIPAGATLRFTTDGSTPTLENGTTSADGKFRISETTILRLRFFQAGQLASQVITRSYILNDMDYSLPILSLVSDDANLYGEDYGIFVQGNGNGRPGNGQSVPCNWNMEWDRPANIEYFNDGHDGFNQEVGIESSGGWSRAWYPHSFNIKANKIYEGANRMDYQFFAEKPFLRHKSLKVRNGGNNVNDNGGGRIKDAAIQRVISTSGLYAETQSYQPVHVFHNGVYIGVENLREPNNKNYGLSNYGMETDDEYMDQWKMSPDSGYVQQVGTRDVFDEWYSLAQNAADYSCYERIKEIVDIEQYINYCAIELYLAGTDWPKNNIKSFRAREEGTSNSRFRFVLFDLDGAFATGNSFTWFESTRWWTFDQLYGSEILAQYGNRITKEIEFTTLLLNMWQNEEFKKQFIDQFCIITGSVFEPTRAANIINGIVNAVNPAMALEGRSATSTGSHLTSNLSSSRQSTSVTNMRNYFGLATPMTAKLSSDLPEARLLINGLEVPTAKFNGRLFHPITLTAQAPAGYAFKGWIAEQAPSSATLIAKGTAWKYYDQGSLDGQNWQQSSFNVVSWPSGRAPLGYDTGNATKAAAYGTTLDYGGNAQSKNPTYYFRRNVTLSEAPTDDLTLDWVADDGFVIYVNGTEAGRFLMNNTPAPTYNSYADSYAEANPESGQMALSASLFKKGSNTIAVELHNNSANSTDVYWDAALYNNQEAPEVEIISTAETYEVPEQTTSLKLIASYERLPEDDAQAWDRHPVKINEVSASNDIYVSDLFKKSDWIELYNTTDNDIDLEGFFISDHLDQPEKAVITAGANNVSTIIPAHGHKIIWADKSQGISQLHADFKLNNEDSSLVVITAPDKTWADTLVYCRHDGFHTVGLYPDGSSQLYVMERPTISQTNVLTMAATTWDEPAIESTIYDNIRQQAAADLMLAYDGQRLTLIGAEAARLDVYSLSGQLVKTARITAASPVGVADLPRGIYVARAATDADDITLKFIRQ